MRCLITGGGGFVGSHLTEHLASAAVEAFTYERTDGDICDLARLRAAVAEARPDVVFHLAAQSSAARSFEDPVGTYHVNVSGTVALLEALRAEAPGARVVVASSSEVYGAVPPGEQPVSEDRPLRPLNPYAASKASQELAALQYVGAYGTDVVVARCFTSVGPRQAADFALPSFASQLARIARGEREPVLRVGNLDVARDFTDVRDMARALALLARRGETGAVYNICSGRAVSLRAALDLLVRASGAGARLEVDPARLRPADVPILTGSSARLAGATGWSPEIPIERSLADLYAHELAAIS